MKILLEDIKVFAYHGWYDEERETGHWFSTTLELDVVSSENGSDNLNDVFNYEIAYQIVVEEMKHTKKLLETVSHNIVTAISKYDQVLEIKIYLSKLHPLKMNEVDKVTIINHFVK